jgi:chromosome segregation ATPase
MEEEIEVVRSELRGSTGELVSFKESLDSAESLINSLQSELHDKRAQVSVRVRVTARVG